MTVFNRRRSSASSPVLLGIPLNGVDPRLQHLGTKSGSRKVFRGAGVALPEGREDLRAADGAIDALVDLKRRKPGLPARRRSSSTRDSRARSNAVFRFPRDRGSRAIRESARRGGLRRARRRTPRATSPKFAAMGGIVEEMIEAAENALAERAAADRPLRRVVLISTHDQILGGPTGQVYLGGRFPRGRPTGSGSRTRRCGSDRHWPRTASSAASAWTFWRGGGGGSSGRSAPSRSTCASAARRTRFSRSQFLTGGRLDPRSGTLPLPGGACQVLHRHGQPEVRGVSGPLPEDLIDITTANRLHYDYGSETGVLFHMIGAISQYGKVGMTAIGNSHPEADARLRGGRSRSSTARARPGGSPGRSLAAPGRT